MVSVTEIGLVCTPINDFGRNLHVLRTTLFPGENSGTGQQQGSRFESVRVRGHRCATRQNGAPL